MLQIRNEFGTLRELIACDPSNFEIGHPINPTQEYSFEHTPPQRKQLVFEHGVFLKVLQDIGIEIRYLGPIQGCPYQMFTRDVGFVVGNDLYVSQMMSEWRQSETSALAALARSEGWQMRQFRNGPIEGGDIVVGGGEVYVGVSSRTSWESCCELAHRLQGRFEVIPVRLAEKILHLDTVLALPCEGLALAYLPGMPDGVPRSLVGHSIIEVNMNEAITLGTNVLSVSPKCIISQERHDRINRLLSANGLDVIPVPMDEITKLGGGPRCCTLPIDRA